MSLEQRIQTRLGHLAVSVDERPGTRPIVLLHGLFLDRSLWQGFGSDITGHTHIVIDMPAHGDSDDVGNAWSQDDCTGAIITVLDELAIDACIAIGHSWGAITAVQAATRHPERFAALGLFNMPFAPPSALSRIGSRMQKLLGHFPRFYARQVARAIYTDAFLREHPGFIQAMQDGLARRSPAEIARIVDAVMVNATDLVPLLRTLPVPALAVVGETDHVGEPPGVPTRTARGAHVTPQEDPSVTRETIVAVVKLAEKVS